MHVPLRDQLIQRVPWFFGPCFEHLEFLHRDCGFSYDGEEHAGPDAYARMVFTRDYLQLQVWCSMPMDLPELSVISTRGKRRVLDLSAVVPGEAPANDPGRFYGKWKQVPPLNQEGQAEVDREFETAVADRIQEFVVFLRKHLDELNAVA